MGLRTTLDINHHVSFAHRLKDDTGACKNLHGHTWIITAKILGKVKKITGMIEDFGAIKKTIKEGLDREYDHACVLQKGDIYIGMIKTEGGRILELKEPPTTEVLASMMMTSIQKILNAHFKNLKVVELTLQETPSNAVTVTRK